MTAINPFLRLLITIVSLSLLQATHAIAQEREVKVRQDIERFKNDDRWIYNNLNAAFQMAQKTTKPVLVIFRCIPCEACSQFDKQVIDEQQGISDILDQFVCARVVHANAMDLSLFQFDFDQSFHAVMLNADKVIYGRFGTRSDRHEEEDMTMEGFREALLGALELHKAYPKNREQLEKKRMSDATVATPEEYPSLKGKYGPKLDYEGKVVQSCIHCHQVREAERLTYRSAKKPLPAKVLFPYPLPDVLGLRMDPKHRATILEVSDESIAAQAGVQEGDQILEMADQPLLSTADLQWVLHHASETDDLPLKVQRGNKSMDLNLALPEGWRERSNISWRATTWDLRRMATGGLWLESIPESELPKNVKPDQMALRVRHAGEYGEHAVAKRAGFQKGDILVAVDDKTEPISETDLIAYALEKPIGAKLKFQVVRGEEELELSFAVQ